MVSTRAVDFSNVKDGGSFNRNRIPAGDYLATITKVDDAEAKDGTFQFLFSIKVDKHPSRVLPYYCKLQENQLWKLRNLLIAAGLTVPKKKMKVDPNRVVGKKIGITVEDDEYEGKEQSTIAAVFPQAELADYDEPTGGSEDDDDEDEPDHIDDIDTASPATDDEEDDEEEAEEAGDAYADLDRTALKAELKKRDASFQARKSQTDDDLRQLLREDDASKAQASSGGVSDDDLEELDIDDL